MNGNKEYLGDSVYVEHDGFMLTLTTENGYGPSNTIHLEPEVYRNLAQYVAREYERQREEPTCQAK